MSQFTKFIMSAWAYTCVVSRCAKPSHWETSAKSMPS